MHSARLIDKALGGELTALSARDLRLCPARLAAPIDGRQCDQRRLVGWGRLGPEQDRGLVVAVAEVRGTPSAGAQRRLQRQGDGDVAGSSVAMVG